MEGYIEEKKTVTIRENENSVIDVTLNKKDNEKNNVRDTSGNTTEKAKALFKEGNEFYKKKDYKNAIRLYRDAADIGNAYAMNNLGSMYEHGEGVDQSHLEAVKWYKKAAELGDSLAMNNLGIMYVHGVGVSHNYTEALKWFKKAAELGCVPAFYNIGVLYANGNGVKRDISEALKWFKEAHRLGYKDSERIIADLESEQRRNVLNRNRFSTPTLNRNSQSVPYYNRNRSSQNNRYRIR
jgi:TPR repeat protein